MSIYNVTGKLMNDKSRAIGDFSCFSTLSTPSVPLIMTHFIKVEYNIIISGLIINRMEEVFKNMQWAELTLSVCEIPISWFVNKLILQKPLWGAFMKTYDSITWIRFTQILKWNIRNKWSMKVKRNNTKKKMRDCWWCRLQCIVWVIRASGKPDEILDQIFNKFFSITFLT